MATTTNLAPSRPERESPTPVTTTNLAPSRPGRQSPTRVNSRQASRSRASVAASRASRSARLRIASLASELAEMRSRSSVNAARASRASVSQRLAAEASQSSVSVASESREEAQRYEASILSVSAASVASQLASVDQILATATIPSDQEAVLAAIASLTAVTATATGDAATAALSSLGEAANSLSAIAQNDADLARSINNQLNPSQTISRSTDVASDSGLTGGEVAAVVLSVLAGVTLFLLLGIFCWRRKRDDEQGGGGSIFPWNRGDHGRRISDRYASGWSGEKTPYDGGHDVSRAHDGTDMGISYPDTASGPTGAYHHDQRYDNRQYYDADGREMDDRWDEDDLSRGGLTRMEDYQDADAGEDSNFLASAGAARAYHGDSDDVDWMQRRIQANGQEITLAHPPSRSGREVTSMGSAPSMSQDRASKVSSRKSTRTLSGFGSMLVGGILSGTLSRRKQAPANPRFPIDDDDDHQITDNSHLENEDEDANDFYSHIGNRGPRKSADLRYRQTPEPSPASRNMGFAAGQQRRSSRLQQGWSEYDDNEDDEDDADSITTIEVRSDSDAQGSADEGEADEGHEGESSENRRLTLHSSRATVGLDDDERREISPGTAEENLSEDDAYDDDVLEYSSPTAAAMARLSRASREAKTLASNQAEENPFAEGKSEAGPSRIPSLPSDFGHGNLGLHAEHEDGKRVKGQKLGSEVGHEDIAKSAAIGTSATGAGALTGLAAKHRLSNGSTYSKGQYPRDVSSRLSTQGGDGASRHSTFLSSGTNLLGPDAIASRNNSQQSYHLGSSRQTNIAKSDDIIEEVVTEDWAPASPPRVLRPQLSTIFSESEVGTISREGRSEGDLQRSSASDFGVAPLAVRKKRSATITSLPISERSDEVPPAYTSQDGGGRWSASRRAASMEASQSQIQFNSNLIGQSDAMEPTGSSSSGGGILGGITAGLRRLTSTFIPASRTPGIGSHTEENEQERPSMERHLGQDSSTIPTQAAVDQGSLGGVASRLASHAGVSEQSQYGSNSEGLTAASKEQSSEEGSVPSIGHASFGVGRVKASETSRGATIDSSEEQPSTTAESQTGYSASLSTSTRSGGTTSRSVGGRSDRFSGRRSLSSQPASSTMALSTRAQRGDPSSGSGSGSGGTGEVSSLDNGSSRRTEKSGRTDAATLGSDDTLRRKRTMSSSGGLSGIHRDFDREIEYVNVDSGEGIQPTVVNSPHFPSETLGDAILRHVRREAGLHDDEKKATIQYPASTFSTEKQELITPTQWRPSPRVKTASEQASAALQLQRRPQHTYQPSADYSIASSTSHASFEIPPPSYGLPDARRGAMRNSRSFSGAAAVTGSGGWPNAPRVSLLQGHGEMDGSNEKEGLRREMGRRTNQRGPGWFAY